MTKERLRDIFLPSIYREGLSDDDATIKRLLDVAGDAFENGGLEVAIRAFKAQCRTEHVHRAIIRRYWGGADA